MSEKAQKSEQKNKIQKSNAKSTFTKSINLKTKEQKGRYFTNKQTQLSNTARFLCCCVEPGRRREQFNKKNGRWRAREAYNSNS